MGPLAQPREVLHTRVLAALDEFGSHGRESAILDRTFRNNRMEIASAGGTDKIESPIIMPIPSKGPLPTLPPPPNFNAKPFAYHQEITLEIATLTNLGVGLETGADGWVVMVPFALPGETVKVRIYRNHANYSDGDLAEVIKASPARRKAECPLFGECGGCQYQHLAYEEQLAWKQRQVREVLARIGGLPDAEVRPTHPSPRQFHYRSKITPHYNRPRRDGSFPIGFLRMGSRDAVVDVPQCPIATEAINAALPAVRNGLVTRVDKIRRAGSLLLRETREGVVTDPGNLVSANITATRSFNSTRATFSRIIPTFCPNWWTTRWVRRKRRA